MSDSTYFQTQPITVMGTLADRVTGVLLQKIKTGEIALNTRLPSESVLAERFGVSRTVIREAISRLKSEGLVATRQGVGTIVVEPAVASFQIDEKVKDSIQAVLRVLELRRGIEAEMAALAAERRTESQNIQIGVALRAIDQAVLAGRDGVEEDLAFHAAISEATGNALYTSLLQFLSQFLREAITVGRMNEAQRQESIGQLQTEHAAIADAISRQDVAGARLAALQHLENVAARIKVADAGFWSSEGGVVARRLALAEMPQ